MLVIKMLKKATGMNNSELAKYLKKSRNTIASWEENKDNIPKTEKIRLSKRFQFDYDYWNVGLDQTAGYYQRMYNDIKIGYLNDCDFFDFVDYPRIDEILDNCDSKSGCVDSYRRFDLSNEANHYLYIKSLCEGIDPIDNTRLDEDHFIYSFKDTWEAVKKYFDTFEEKEQPTEEDDKYYETNMSVLKEWRRKQAEIEGIKPFQVVSDEILKDIVKATINGDSELSKTKIKNFPKGGKKWNKYYELIKNELPF